MKIKLSQFKFIDVQEMATVYPIAAWDAVEDAKTLRAAMKGFGTSESEITQVLCQRSNRQRQNIADAYTKQFGRVNNQLKHQNVS